MSRTTPDKPRDYDHTRIVERPDGYYWQARETQEEYGPFATLSAAVDDMLASDEGGYEPGESLTEAESEIGIAEWIDPDTGEPAEESVPRIEDH